MRRRSIDPAAIEAEIAHLRSLALDALRRHWRVIFGRTPPADLSKDLLGRMIAWRLQERAFGGLDRESLKFLDGLARQGGSPRRQLKPGTVLVRDYQDQHQASSPAISAISLHSAVNRIGSARRSPCIRPSTPRAQTHCRRAPGMRTFGQRRQKQ